MKKVLVLGAGGFIGSHLVKKLKENGCWVRGVDLKRPEYWDTFADEFIIGDLREQRFVESVFKLESRGGYPIPYDLYVQPFTDKLQFDEVYQLAADMGGAGYIFTGENDADIMYNSSLINLNVLDNCVKSKTKKIFYSSSACMYPQHNQTDIGNPNCEESSAYPANPDSEYGWEKLFSERLYMAYHNNYNIDVKIARFHNIFGPYGTYKGGKEKAPAALCRKISETSNEGEIEVWGDGQQTRSFLYIDECIEGIFKLMDSNFNGPVNIGSEEIISINELSKKIIKISNKDIKIKNVEGPTGVRGRNSDNRLIFKELGWKPNKPLIDGLIKTYEWINKIVNNE
jgi:nucleoside-diphosphate-sugar epimerase